MLQQQRKHAFIAVSCLILFIIISILSLRNQLTRMDEVIISFFIERSSSFHDSVMEVVTKIGSGETILLLTVVIGGYLLYKKMWGFAILLFTVSFGGIALNFILKILFQRARPGEMTVIEVFGQSLEIASYSFPSGHTMRSVLLFSFLFFLCARLLRNSIAMNTFSTLFIIMMGIVALSRVIIGAHFPSDILAAITISIFWFYFCLITFRILFRNSSLYI
ncbi:phosphatase PAP2 family protein [Bacillus sp. B15-48]|uniref:phosphatase PAP2 family protein n=1 Tax=Bacillus sp. B15-48 TaxID=1548601 RepID=UPI00193F2EEB|nr:phosphatase PAP2 family protein [Bacillus sp. B15-48]MBM4763829.1 phosphatase PAP2 family protein [Bacillus sp. B15-48]